MLRIIFPILICIHASIHLLGFVKAFGISEVKQLTQAISKPFGIGWLLAFIFFTITAILLFMKSNVWWPYAFIGIFFSQILIVVFWQDAKFGTILNIIILIVAIIGFGTWKYYQQYQKDVESGMQQDEYFSTGDLTELDIQHLPDPVKKYLRYTGSIGKPKVNSFKIEFSGKIRKNELSEWMPFRSEQYNFMQEPTRLFFMKATMKQLPIAGYHCYKNGIASMDIRLFSIFRVQYQDGIEMDMAETVTFFNDMCCMAPPTLIDSRIKWLEVDGNQVMASFTNKNITIHARLFFNDSGALINFISEDRYNSDEGKKLPWATPLKDYGEVNGYKLFGNAETIYSYPDRDLCYGTFQLTNIEYNCKLPN